MYQSGRVGDEAKMRKSPAKSGRVGITAKVANHLCCTLLTVDSLNACLHQNMTKEFPLSCVALKKIEVTKMFNKEIMNKNRSPSNLMGS